MRHVLVGCVVLVLVAVLAGPAWAQVGELREDSFYGEFEGWNDYVAGSGGGTGWNNGEWIFYSETDWWNQWFYNDPLDMTRWKLIEYDIWVDPTLPEGQPIPGFVDVVLNWSTPDYPPTGPDGDPPMPTQEQWIERSLTIASGPNELPWEEHGSYIIPDFNPEWVSIDVYVESNQWVDLGQGDEMVPLPVYISGDIRHQCIPEPSTIVLLAMGALGLVAFAWRRRKR